MPLEEALLGPGYKLPPAEWMERHYPTIDPLLMEDAIRDYNAMLLEEATRGMDHVSER